MYIFYYICTCIHIHIYTYTYVQVVKHAATGKHTYVSGLIYFDRPSYNHQKGATGIGCWHL